MDLFHSDAVAPGMIFWHANGWRLFQSVLNHMRKVYRRSGFREINTPILLKQELWQMSGHLDKFAENMFMVGALDSPREYALKPMSCPAHILHYKRGVYSYRDLPLKIFEFGIVHRHEPSGSLNGCLRLRQFTQDDAHVFCQWQQAQDEIIKFLLRARRVYQQYGYEEMEVKISTQPQNSFGERVDWERAENLLASACQAAEYHFEYQVGEGAFYGPKIELSLKDFMGRDWQCGTIQLDFNLPKRFGLSYVEKDQGYRSPVILHQAMYGSIERWIGILLESFQGKLPPWVHPLPLAIASVGENAAEYAKKIEQILVKADIPVMVDISNNTLSRKIRRCHELNVPYVLVVGQKEVEKGVVNLRLPEGSKNQQISLDRLLEVIQGSLGEPLN